MTTDMLIGGLMILTMVAGIVIAMTSSQSSDSDRFEGGDARHKDHNDRGV